MKTKILKGIVMMSVVVLGACTTTKYAAQQKDYNDDVYYSKAKAGDVVEYASNDRSYRNDGYYDNYAGRINRFNNYSPFAYDGFYNSYYGTGLALGLGYGLGSFYGYSPYSFYSPYSLYSPYSYYGTGYYGIGGSPYMGLYSGYSNVNSSYGARPSRGTGNPGSYTGTVRGSSVIPGRGNIPTSTGYSARPTRQEIPQVQRSYPTYTPSPSSNSNGGGFGGGGGGSRVSSSRPGRG